MRVLDRGTSSVQDVMSVCLFNVVPQLVDVVAACAFIALRLQLWTAVIVFVTGAGGRGEGGWCVAVPEGLLGFQPGT